MLFPIVKYPGISANELNHDLDIIHKWAHQWKLEFNPDPTKQATEILFYFKKFSSIHPQILFNGTVVVKMSEQKHLGRILVSKLSFENILMKKLLKLTRTLELSNTFLVFYHLGH